MWGQTITWENDDVYFHTDASIDDHVDAAVLLYGLYDFNNFLQSTQPIAALAAQYFAGDSDARAKGLAVNHAANVSTPVLLIHGTADETFEFQQSVQFHDSLQANGKTSQLELFEDAGHVFDLNATRTAFSSEGEVVRDMVLAFLSNALYMTTSVEEVTTQIPLSFTLEQNYPNPFNPVTLINYTVPSETRVLLTVYDLLGKKVRTLIDDHHLPGTHVVYWDSNDHGGVPVSSGLYFYEMRASEFRQVRKMTLIR